jgi:hypothetical protein
MVGGVHTAVLGRLGTGQVSRTGGKPVGTRLTSGCDRSHNCADPPHPPSRGGKTPPGRRRRSLERCGETARRAEPDMTAFSYPPVRGGSVKPRPDIAGPASWASTDPWRPRRAVARTEARGRCRPASLGDGSAAPLFRGLAMEPRCVASVFPALIVNAHISPRQCTAVTTRQRPGLGRECERSHPPRSALRGLDHALDALAVRLPPPQRGRPSGITHDNGRDHPARA